MTTRFVHWLHGPDATEKANNMMALGWQITETGMDPYGQPTFLLGWVDPFNNPPGDTE